MAPILIVLGISVSVFGILITRHADRERQWLQVDGNIISSEVKFEWEDYSPVIVYEYTVGGVTRTGTKVRPLLMKYNWSGPAKRLCERYHAGKKVTVFVDAKDPSNSLLELENDWASLPVFLSVGVSLLVVGILLL